MALLALAPCIAEAQYARHDPFARDDAPVPVLNFGPEQVRNLNLEFEDDIRALNAYGGRRRMDRFVINTWERPTPWMAYGRLGPLNFQNEIESQRSQGLRFSFRRTGPKLGGRVYFGIHRTFD